MPQQNIQTKTPQVDPQLRASLLALLNLMKNKAQKDNLHPVIKTHKLIQLLRTSGVTISYHQLLDLTNDPSVQPLIKDINKDQTTLRLDSDEDADMNDLDISSDDPEEMPQQDDEGMEQGDGMDQAGEVPPTEEPEDYDVGPTGHSGRSIISQMASRAMKRS